MSLVRDETAQELRNCKLDLRDALQDVEDLKKSLDTELDARRQLDGERARLRLDIQEKEATINILRKQLNANVEQLEEQAIDVNCMEEEVEGIQFLSAASFDLFEKWVEEATELFCTSVIINNCKSSTGSEMEFREKKVHEVVVAEEVVMKAPTSKSGFQTDDIFEEDAWNAFSHTVDHHVHSFQQTQSIMFNLFSEYVICELQQSTFDLQSELVSKFENKDSEDQRNICNKDCPAMPILTSIYLTEHHRQYARILQLESTERQTHLHKFFNHLMKINNNNLDNFAQKFISLIGVDLSLSRQRVVHAEAFRWEDLMTEFRTTLICLHEHKNKEVWINSTHDMLEHVFDDTQASLFGIADAYFHFLFENQFVLFLEVVMNLIDKTQRDAEQQINFIMEVFSVRECEVLYSVFDCYVSELAHDSFLRPFVIAQQQAQQQSLLVGLNRSFLTTFLERFYEEKLELVLLHFVEFPQIVSNFSASRLELVVNFFLERESVALTLHSVATEMSANDFCSRQVSFEEYLLHQLSTAHADVERQRMINVELKREFEAFAEEVQKDNALLWR